MPLVERQARVAGRGRDEATPFYLHLGLLIGIGGVVAVIVGVCFAIYYLL